MVCMLPSLRRMQRLVVERSGARAGWALVGAVSLLTGAGVYLGRVLRWNSWDLLSRPDALLAETRANVAASRPAAEALVDWFLEHVAGA